MKYIFVIAGATVVLVVGLYTYQFGYGLWTDHSKWGELGNFFGGVLGPILAFFSLIYLAIQIEMQWKENKSARISSEIKHKEEYIHYNLSLIQPRLQDNDEILNYPLHELIVKIHKNDENHEKNIRLIKLGLSSRADTLVIWVNICTALSYIKSVEKNKYTSMLTLIAVQLGYGLCAALDDVVKLATGINFEAHFLE